MPDLASMLQIIMIYLAIGMLLALIFSNMIKSYIEKEFGAAPEQAYFRTLGLVVVAWGAVLILFILSIIMSLFSKSE